MSHYHIHIAVDKEDVKIIKEQFEKFLDDCGGMRISVVPYNQDAEVTPELAEAIHSLFVQLVVTLSAGQFEGLN